MDTKTYCCWCGGEYEAHTAALLQYCGEKITALRNIQIKEAV